MNMADAATVGEARAMEATSFTLEGRQEEEVQVMVRVSRVLE